HRRRPRSGTVAAASPRPRPLSWASSALGRLALRSPLGLGLEAERERVHAVAQPRGGAEAVVEDVAQMPAAVGAAHLGAHHAERGVFEKLHGIRVHRVVEAGPAAAGVELGAALEQLGSARRTGVEARAVLVEQLTGPGTLG